MKSLLTVVAVIALLIAIVGSGLMVTRTEKGVKEMEKLEKAYGKDSALGKSVKGALKDAGLASAGTYKMVGNVSIVALLAFLFFTVVMFTKKAKLKLIGAAAAVILAISMVALSPSTDGGKSKYNKQPSTQKVALIIAGIGIAGIAAGMGRDAMGSKKDVEVNA